MSTNIITTTTTRIVVPGVKFEIDGCEVYIVNVIKTSNLKGEPRFLVSVFLVYNNKVSRQYCFDVSSMEEFIRVLKYEIALFKLLVYSGAYDVYSKSW